MKSSLMYFHIPHCNKPLRKDYLLSLGTASKKNGHSYLKRLLNTPLSPELQEKKKEYNFMGHKALYTVVHGHGQPASLARSLPGGGNGDPPGVAACRPQGQRNLAGYLVAGRRVSQDSATKGHQVQHP